MTLQAAHQVAQKSIIIGRFPCRASALASSMLSNQCTGPVADTAEARHPPPMMRTRDSVPNLFDIHFMTTSRCLLRPPGFSFNLSTKSAATSVARLQQSFSGRIARTALPFWSESLAVQQVVNLRIQPDRE